MVEQEPAEAPKGTRALVEAVVASTVGTTIEWYDFFLYGLAAADIFPLLFFPEFSPFVATIMAFLTFTAGFLSRPFGGVIFGYLGDRVGRKSSLVATLLLMGLSTILVGCVPPTASIGTTAIFLLTLLRLIQGIGVGGEWGGAVLLALEYGHSGRRGFHASWPQAGVPLGLLLAAGVYGLFKGLLPAQDFLTWGWRIPFFLSGLLILVGLVIRFRILETPLFLKLQQTKQVAQAPVSETVRRYWREILLAAGARISENSCFYLFTVYVITYGKDVLKVEETWIWRGVYLAAALEFVAMPLYGLLSDFWSRKGMYVLGNLVFIAFAFPYYALLDTGQPFWIVTAIVVSVVGGHAMLYSVQASLIPELFGTRLRYTGSSIGYQLAAPIAGGLSPLIAASLVKLFPGRYWPLALYIILISVLSLSCVLFLAETSRKDLSKHE